MTPDRLRECVDTIGWSLRGLAEMLEMGFSTVQRWSTGRKEIPENVAAWLEILAAAHQRNPLPEGWVSAQDEGRKAS